MAVHIAEGIAVLDLPDYVFPPGVFHPVLIWDREEAILVDAGLPGQQREIAAAMEEAGVPFARLSRVILTHHDYDHAGGLQSILSCRRVEVIAHELEQSFIQGDEPSPKPLPAGLSLGDLSARVDRRVVDGQELPNGGGVTVIHTPGHSPGHLCLYHRLSKTLIAGDALLLIEGKLMGPDPRYVLDPDRALSSLRRLAQYDISAVICYHGGVYRGNIRKRIAELAGTYSDGAHA